MQIRFARVALGSAATSLTLACAALAQVGPQMPDSRFDANIRGAQFYVSTDGTLAMRVSHDLPNKKVRLRHHYFYDVPGRRALTQDTLEPLTYWPTNTTPFSNGKFLVAGKSPRSGNTIIELWTVNPPTPPLATQTGIASTFGAGTVAQKQEIYSASSPGRDIVTRLQPMPRPEGPPTHVLVQFYDSRDIYSLDVAHETIVRVASPTAHADCLHVPLLAHDVMSQVRRHVSQGWLYIYSRVDVPDTQTSIAILRDTNLDSVIDGVSTYSLAEYRNAGYSAPEAWIE